MALLRAVGWHGVAMVEFKVDRRDGRPVLLEVNPRFWGSINQAVSAGIDFPYLLYRVAIEGDIEPITSYKLGLKTTFLLNDLRAIFAHLRTSDRWSYTLRQVLKSYERNLHDDVLSVEDPWPMIAYLWVGLKEIFERG